LSTKLLDANVFVSDVESRSSNQNFGDFYLLLPKDFFRVHPVFIAVLN